MPPTIRLATPADAEQIRSIYAPIVANTPISFEVDPPSVEEMGHRIEETLEEFPWLVCEASSELVGYAYASRHRARKAYQWAVDVSVYTRPDFQRRGIARALYCSLLRILTLQGFFCAYAGIALPNGASVGLHEALGFEPVGVYRNVGFKLGRWHDVGWWQLGLQQPTVPGGPPLRMDVARQRQGWQEALRAGEDLLR